MGNALSGIKYYLGYEKQILTPQELLTQTNETKTKKLHEEIKLLQEQIDKNNDNVVTKDELKEYFEQLTNRIDKNSDGIVSQEELETYVNEQLDKSKDEIEKWKNAYELLHDKYEKLLDTIKSDETTILEVSNVSTQALKDYIKSEIIDTEANLKLVPDPLERKIYLTVLKTIMKSVEGLFNTTSVDILNHRISFAINPVPEKERHHPDPENK